jgi:hypothetical protein
MKTGKVGASTYSRPSSGPDKASAISSFKYVILLIVFDLGFVIIKLISFSF